MILWIISCYSLGQPDDVFLSRSPCNFSRFRAMKWPIISINIDDKRLHHSWSSRLIDSAKRITICRKIQFFALVEIPALIFSTVSTHQLFVLQFGINRRGIGTNHITTSIGLCFCSQRQSFLGKQYSVKPLKEHQRRKRRRRRRAHESDDY